MVCGVKEILEKRQQKRTTQHDNFINNNTAKHTNNTITTQTSLHKPK